MFIDILCDLFVAVLENGTDYFCMENYGLCESVKVSQNNEHYLVNCQEICSSYLEFIIEPNQRLSMKNETSSSYEGYIIGQRDTTSVSFSSISHGLVIFFKCLSQILHTNNYWVDCRLPN